MTVKLSKNKEALRQSAETQAQEKLALQNIEKAQRIKRVNREIRQESFWYTFSHLAIGLIAGVFGTLLVQGFMGLSPENGPQPSLVEAQSFRIPTEFVLPS